MALLLLGKRDNGRIDRFEIDPQETDLVALVQAKLEQGYTRVSIVDASFYSRGHKRAGLPEDKSTFIKMLQVFDPTRKRDTPFFTSPRGRSSHAGRQDRNRRRR